MSEGPPVASSSQTVGPFFHLGLKPQSSPADGDSITLTMRVTDGDGRPVEDGLIELWNVSSFVRLATDSTGTSTCEIARAPYINVCFFARGLLRQLHTRVYFGAEPSLASDPVLRLVPESRRQTLVAASEAERRWVFHLRLQGPQETVFFEV